MGPFYVDAMSESETPENEIEQDDLPTDVQEAVDGFERASDEGHKYSVLCSHFNPRRLREHTAGGIFMLDGHIRVFVHKD
jgi:hypothetical protein